MFLVYRSTFLPGGHFYNREFQRNFSLYKKVSKNFTFLKTIIYRGTTSFYHALNAWPYQATFIVPRYNGRTRSQPVYSILYTVCIVGVPLRSHLQHIPRTFFHQPKALYSVPYAYSFLHRVLYSYYYQLFLDYHMKIDMSIIPLYFC